MPRRPKSTYVVSEASDLPDFSREAIPSLVLKSREGKSYSLSLVSGELPSESLRKSLRVVGLDTEELLSLEFLLYVPRMRTHGSAPFVRYPTSPERLDEDFRKLFGRELP